MKRLVTGCLIAIAASASTATAQDTVRVRAGAPAWGTNVGLKELYVLGGPPEYDIGIVYSTAVDKFNRVYVYDMKASQIRAYDANGKFLRTVGRKGGGPGEYGLVMGATIVEDTVLAAYDISGLRMNYYNPDGAFLRTVTLERNLNTTSTGVLVSDTQDRLYFKALWIRGPDGRGVNLPPAQQQTLRLATDGRVLDSVPIVTFPSSSTAFNPFKPGSAYWDTPIGGEIFGTGDTYRFAIRPWRGPIRIVEKDWTPTPVGSEERSQWIAHLEEAARRDPRRASFDIPKSKPAYKDLRATADGRIWVQVYAASEKRPVEPSTRPNPIPAVEWKQQPTYDVFDPSGVYLARVKAPWGSSLWYARGDRVWFQSIGPEEEQRLTAYQLTGIRK